MSTTLERILAIAQGVKDTEAKGDLRDRLDRIAEEARRSLRGAPIQRGGSPPAEITSGATQAKVSPEKGLPRI